MTVEQLKQKVENNEAFVLGFAEDIKADLYSVYLGGCDKGIWTICMHHRRGGVEQSNIGVFEGMTLEQYLSTRGGK